MSKRYPKEFRDDVVRVARNRGSGVTLAQIANDFGVSKASLSLLGCPRKRCQPVLESVGV